MQRPRVSLSGMLNLCINAVPAVQWHSNPLKLALYLSSESLPRRRPKRPAACAAPEGVEATSLACDDFLWTRSAQDMSVGAHDSSSAGEESAPPLLSVNSAPAAPASTPAMEVRSIAQDEHAVIGIHGL